MDTRIPFGEHHEFFEDRYLICYTCESHRVLFEILPFDAEISDGKDVRIFTDEAGQRTEDVSRARSEISAEVLYDGESALSFRPEGTALQFFGRAEMRTYCRLLERLYDIAAANIESWSGED